MHTTNTQIHDQSVSLLGTDTSVTSGGVWLVLVAQTLMFELFQNKLPMCVY